MPLHFFNHFSFFCRAWWPFFCSSLAFAWKNDLFLLIWLDLLGKLDFCGHYDPSFLRGKLDIHETDDLFCFSLDFAWKIGHLRTWWPFFCSSLDFAWKIGHFRIFFSKYVIFFSTLPYFFFIFLLIALWTACNLNKLCVIIVIFFTLKVSHRHYNRKIWLWASRITALRARPHFSEAYFLQT